MFLNKEIALKRSLVVAFIASAAMVALPCASQAQMPFHLGVAGGGSLPMSDLSDGSNTGFNGTVTIGFSIPMIPVGLRIDGAYNRFGAKVGGGDLNVMSATGNLMLKLPSIGISPYLIGGAGFYNSKVTPTGLGSSNSQSDFGWNAGAGISLPLTIFQGFVEARYNKVTTDLGSMAFVPVTFGIMF